MGTESQTENTGASAKRDFCPEREDVERIGAESAPDFHRAGEKFGLAEVRQFGDLSSVKTSTGKYFGFHNKNLVVAELNSDIHNIVNSQDRIRREKLNREKLSGETDGSMDEVKSLDPLIKDEIVNELLQWNAENDSETIDESGLNSKKPNVLQINIAQICNLACNYCAAGGDGTYGEKEQIKVDLDLAYKQVSSMVSRLVDGDVFSIYFFGGEPLIYPDAIKSIAEYARMMVAGRDISLRFTVTTNGTLINSKIAAMLSNLNARVIVSLDGPSEINEKMRPAKNQKLSSTNATEKGLDELLKVRDGLSHLQISCVLGEHNTDASSSYKFFRRWKPDSIAFGYALEEETSETMPRYIVGLREALELAFDLDGVEGVMRINPVASLIQRIQEKVRNRNHCGAGQSTLQMDTRGRLYSCQWLMNDESEIVGHAKMSDNTDKKSVVRSLGGNSRFKDLIEANNCSTCWARYLCGGGCVYSNKMRTGDKHKKDLGFCARMHQMAALSIEYFTKINEFSA